MSKLNKIDKAYRRELLAALALADGEVFSFPDGDFLGNYAGGVTIAIRPALGSERAKFVHVAVAVCSENDKFKRKRGELIALDRLDTDEVIRIPRNGRTLREVAEDVERVVTGY